MTSVLLPDDIRARVVEEASRRGVDVQSLAVELIEKGLPTQTVPTPGASAGDADATVALLQRWMAEDAATDPAELDRQRVEGEEFMGNLDRNRRESDGPTARPLWP